MGSALLAWLEANLKCNDKQQPYIYPHEIGSYSNEELQAAINGVRNYLNLQTVPKDAF